MKFVTLWITKKSSDMQGIINGGFENGIVPDPWTVDDGSVDTFDPHSGTYCCQVDDDEFWLEQVFSSTILIEDILTFSVWIKASTTSDMNVTFTIDSNIVDYEFATPDDDEWHKYDLKAILRSFYTTGTLESVAFWVWCYGALEYAAVDDVSLIMTVKETPVEKNFLRVHYIKSHPSSDPDTFEVVLTPEQMVGIKNFDSVEIKKDGNTEFYGFIEEITPEIGEDGLEYIVSGRCWKVILWKKWTERYQESREVGPYDSEHDVIESGFFGSVNPTELLKFIMRCPVSIHPKGWVRHKIGWGIPSDDWTYCTNETAECFYPDWVGMRTTGLSWRSRGTITEMSVSTLVVNNFTAAKTEWVESGVSPYLDTDDDAANMIYVEFPTNSTLTEGDFEFADLGGTAETVYSVTLCIKAVCKFTYVDNYVTTELWDGSAWHGLGVFKTESHWKLIEINVGNILNTVAKVNAAKIRFQYLKNLGLYAGAGVSYAYLKVEWAPSTYDAIFQRPNDYFIINVEAPYPRVTGILLECRNNPINYARNYEIKYASISGCCSFGEEVWNDFTPAVAVTNNIYRDILHSWNPVDDVHCIRIQLTASADNSWEISQAYVWQGDE